MPAAASELHTRGAVDMWSGGVRRAALLGIATGELFGLTVAFMKAVTHAFTQGLFSGVTAWQTYAMLAAGVAAMYTLQNALQAGRLAAAQPGIMFGLYWSRPRRW